MNDYSDKLDKDLGRHPNLMGGRGSGRMAKDPFPTFNLRMPPDLRQHLARECGLSGRSMNAEIIHRLRVSLAPPRADMVQEPGGEYAPQNDLERALLTVFRRLSPEKQLALLSLFK